MRLHANNDGTIENSSRLHLSTYPIQLSTLPSSGKRLCFLLTPLPKRLLCTTLPQIIPQLDLSSKWTPIPRLLLPSFLAPARIELGVSAVDRRVEKDFEDQAADVGSVALELAGDVAGVPGVGNYSWS